MAKPIPEGYHTVTPSLTFKDTRRAIDFYKKAFGAKEKEVFPGPDGKGVMHAEITIGNSVIMMGDENPRNAMKSAETLGSATGGFCLYVNDSDASFKQAVSVGGKVENPVAEMFWGDRGGSLTDPFGYSWWIMTHKRDLSHEEMLKAGQQAMAQPAGHK